MFSATTEQMFQHYHCPPERPHQQPIIDTKSRPNAEIAPNCPRCASANTKFCYYNNYSLSQPRYFCKACRRYWTKGGSLRNVPIGGGCRKSRRSKSSKNSISTNSYYSDRNLSSGSNEDSFNNRASPDIDLADVFAKFLNPNSSLAASNQFVDQEFFTNEMVDFSNSPSSVNETPDSVQEFHFPNEAINLLGENEEPETMIRDLLMESDDLSSFGLQDVLWGESDSVNTNFNWQLPAAIVVIDDQLMRIGSTPNLDTDTNWSSSDISGF